MRTVAAPALLLDVFDLHDRDRVVTFLTAEHGKKRGVARGARRKYSRFSGRLQPLSKVRIAWFEKDGRDLVRIEDADLLRPATRFQSTLEGILLSAVMADHMLEFAQENEASGPFFRLLDSSLAALEEGAALNLAARYYETWVLRLAGIFPAPRECPLCGRELSAEEPAALAAAGDALVCTRCAGSGAERVSAMALTFLRRSARESLPAIAATPPSREALAEVEQVAGKVRRAFLGHELKSYQVLRQTLGTTALP